MARRRDPPPDLHRPLRRRVHRRSAAPRLRSASKGLRRKVVRTFEESVSTAGSKYREQFELLLGGLERGDYDIVIEWNLDRLTRNRSDTLRLIAIGERKKTLISLIRGMELDMSTPMGRRFTGILAR